MKKIVFFGCPLDADERHESIQEKLALIGSQGVIDDPYEGVMGIVRREIPPEIWSELGSMELPSWLRPIPSLIDEPRINTEAFVDFIDQGGDETYARKVKQCQCFKFTEFQSFGITFGIAFEFTFFLHVKQC